MAIAIFILANFAILQTGCQEWDEFARKARQGTLLKRDKKSATKPAEKIKTPGTKPVVKPAAKSDSDSTATAKKNQQTPTAKPAPSFYSKPAVIATLKDKSINESSGISASRITPGVLWTHNDSGGKPRVFAIDKKGNTLAVVNIKGITATDWEDMFSYSSKGKNYLVLADVGDNKRIRKNAQLVFIQEPKIDPAKRNQTFEVNPVKVIKFSYPDKPRNCEAVAICPQSNRIFLISKTRKGKAKIYYLDMPEKTLGREFILQELCRFPHLPAVTGMDISADSSSAVVCTYRNAFVYRKSPKQSWSDAFSKKPLKLKLPRRKQGESICFSAKSKTLYLTSEQLPAPLIEISARVQSPYFTGKPTRIFTSKKANFNLREHCFIYDKKSKLHLFGITGKTPVAPRDDGTEIFHAVQVLGQKELELLPSPIAFAGDEKVYRWCPKIEQRSGKYYLRYRAGAVYNKKKALRIWNQMRLAVSDDLKEFKPAKTDVELGVYKLIGKKPNAKIDLDFTTRSNYFYKIKAGNIFYIFIADFEGSKVVTNVYWSENENEFLEANKLCVLDVRVRSVFFDPNRKKWFASTISKDEKTILLNELAWE